LPTQRSNISLIGDRIEIVEFFAASPDGDDEARVFKPQQMFGHGLTGYVHMRAQFAEGLAIVFVEQVEQSATSRVSKRLKDSICSGGHVAIMQPFGCIMQANTG
jgi:hypothetical protein